MLFVTFHGGSTPGAGPRQNVNTVYAYPDGGSSSPIEVLHGDPKRLAELVELRGLGMVKPAGLDPPDAGVLWVLSGSQDHSEIAAFRGGGMSYDWLSTVAYANKPGTDGDASDLSNVVGLVHPFDFAVDPTPVADGRHYVYVSNQDTNVVLRLLVDADWSRAVAAPLSSYLENYERKDPLRRRFPDGSFVASAVVTPDLTKLGRTLIVPLTEGGLDAKFSGSDKKSVRGVAVNEQSLYVADEVARLIKVYACPTGNYLGYISLPAHSPRAENSAAASGPVHLTVTDAGGNQPVLWVCNGQTIFVGTINPRQPVNVALQPLGITVPSAAGLAFSPDGTLFAADRTGQNVYLIDLNGKTATPWPGELPDEPEFLLYTNPSPGEDTAHRRPPEPADPEEPSC